MITIGSKVVCVDDRFPIQILEWASNIPRRGGIYTVRQIKIAPDGTTGIMGKALLLWELDNSLPSGGEVSFAIERFRELQLEEENSNRCEHPQKMASVA